MKKVLSTLMLLGVVIAGVVACKTTKANASSAAIDWKKIRVLIYTKNGKGYIHTNIASATASIQQLGAQNGFAVDVTDKPEDFNDENLKKYNTLIFNNTNNDVFTSDAQKVALMHYVQAGGGFVGIHSASGTERNWPWFKRLLGATFQRHAAHQKFKDIIIDNTHPSTSFLPQVWECDDECYYVKEVNPDLHILSVHELSSVNDNDKPVFYGQSFPSVWCHEFDGGRQWYTSLGHDSTTYTTAVFQKHLLGGIQWVVNGGSKLDYSKARAKSPDDALPY